MAFQVQRSVLTDSNVLLVDVSQKASIANIVREGYQVPTPVVDETKRDFILANLPQIQPQQAPRVVGQSIKPGTKVTPGTVVDLILAPKTAIPFDIFTNVHADFKTKTLDFADPVLNDPNTRQILLTYDTADQVPDAQKAVVTQELANNHITVNEADPERTFAQAYGMLRSGLAYR